MKILRKYYTWFENYADRIVDEKLINKGVSLKGLFDIISKVMFVVIPLIIGGIIVVLYLSLNVQFSSMKSNMLDIIEVGFNENLKLAMNTNDFLKVRNSLDEIRKLSSVEEVTLVDKNKKVIIADELRNEGNTLDYPELNKAFGNNFTEKSFKTDNRLVLIFDNEPSCRRCHMEDAQILGGLVVTFSPLDSMNKTISYLIFIIILGVVMVFVSKVFLNTITERYINSPINSLVKVSKDILRGDVIRNREIKTPVEFNYIFSVLSKMAGDIEEYIEEIKRKNSEKEQIKILAGIGEMAAKVAHEVRNPLNTIDGAIHFLRKTGKSDNESSEYLDLIEENIRRINNVASELLGATRPTKPVLEKVNVVKLLRERIQEFYDAYNITKAEINLEATGEIPIMFIDRHQIIQVIDNLLENALNAVEDKEKGIINISVKKFSPTPMQNFLLLRIADNGCGIPAENLGKLFVPFFTTRGNGTGLGLSIVDKIITNHRGEIKILSKVDKGTIVRIKIPIRT